MWGRTACGIPVPGWRELGSAPWRSLEATAMCRGTHVVQNKQRENKPNANLEEQIGDLPVFSVADGIDLKTGVNHLCCKCPENEDSESSSRGILPSPPSSLP